MRRGGVWGRGVYDGAGRLGRWGGEGFRGCVCFRKTGAKKLGEGGSGIV